jgi:hypothetical protein
MKRKYRFKTHTFASGGGGEEVGRNKLCNYLFVENAAG